MAAELRPAHLDDWLDTLPYANPSKSLDLMLEAMLETRASELKSSVRFELLELYWQRYQFLLNVTVRASGSRPSLAPAQRPLLLPKLHALAAEIGRGCNQTLQGADVTTRNFATTLFRVGQRQARASLLGITAHAHAMLLGFESYLPASEETWRDLHGIFLLAESGMFLDEQLTDPDRPERRTTPRRAYARICACVLAQPAQLDPGAVWQAYEMLADWNDDIDLVHYEPPADPRGVFVIDPERARAPIDLRKIDPTAPTPHWHLLRCSRLAQRCQIELGKIGQHSGTAIRDQNRARTRLLEHLVRHWGDPPRRRWPRQSAGGSAQVVIGLRDIHALFDRGSASEIANLRSWSLLNSSDVGAALAPVGQPAALPRVGELLALRAGGAGNWLLTTIRWLRQGRAGDSRIGTQIICRTARAVMIHAIAGSEFQTQPRPALLMPAEDGPPETLLASPGLYSADLRLLLLDRSQRQEVTAGRVIERTATFDWFSYQ
ncbi:MAG: hypothetical protein IT494_01720 [Gammaproteobacteria bacterium]|nr:hypothetical protein [Gammaproteobacteria bacterium]